MTADERAELLCRVSDALMEAGVSDVIIVIRERDMVSGTLMPMHMDSEVFLEAARTVLNSIQVDLEARKHARINTETCS